MKAQFILTISLVFITYSYSTTTSADIFDSARDITNDITSAAKNITGDVVGDWCSGKKYLSDMELSERLRDGSTDLQKEIEKLNDTSIKMEFDIKSNLEGEVEKIIKSSQDLSKYNNDLCIKSKSTNYTNVDYNGTMLRDKSEVAAQIRINLAAIRTNNKVVEFFNDQKIIFNTLNNRIKSKANELAVLKKNFDNLADPRSNNKGSSYVESVIVNACTAIGEVENLIMEYKSKDASELFRNAARYNQTNTVSESDVSTFMTDCSGVDKTNQDSLLDRAKSLFGF